MAYISLGNGTTMHIPGLPGTIPIVKPTPPISPEVRAKAWYDRKNALVNDFNWLFNNCVLESGILFCQWDDIKRPGPDGQNVLSHIADKIARLTALKAEIEAVYPVFTKSTPMAAKAAWNGANKALGQVAALNAQLAACEKKFRDEHNGWTWEQYQAQNIVEVKAELKAPIVGSVGSRTWGVSAEKGFVKKLEGLSYLCTGR